MRDELQKPPCFFHGERNAAGKCTFCGKLLCSECLEYECGYSICAECRNGKRSKPENEWSGLPGFVMIAPMIALTVTVAGSMAKTGSTANAALLLTAIVLNSMLAIVVVGDVFLRKGMGPGELGFMSNDLFREVIAGMAAGVVLFFAGVLLNGLFENIFYDSRLFRELDLWIRGVTDAGIQLKGQTSLWLYIAISCVLSPFFEETFFRSYLFPPMERVFGGSAGCVLNGMIFSLAHLSVLGFASRWLSGSLFCYMFLKTRRIYMSIFAHMSLNVCTAIMLYTITTGQ